MKVGVLMFMTDYALPVTELAEALEERSFESLWIPEHSHIPISRRSQYPAGGDLPKRYYDCMDPFPLIAAAAVATARLKVATGICIVSQRDPIQTAKRRQFEQIVSLLLITSLMVDLFLGPELAGTRTRLKIMEQILKHDFRFRANGSKRCRKFGPKLNQSITGSS